MRTLVVLIVLLNFAYAEAQPIVGWNYTAGGAVNGVAISEQGEYIAAGAEDGYVYFLNKSGSLLWKSKADYPVLSVAVSSKGEYIVVGDEFKIYLLNSSGNASWHKLIGDGVRDVEISEHITAGSATHYIYLFDREGNESWKYETDGSVFGIAVSAQEIAAGTSNGSVYLFKNNELQWRYNIGRYISDVAIFNQKVIVGSRFLHLIEDGKEAWMYLSKSEISGVDISKDGKNIAASSADGAIYYLDSNGRLLWSYNANKTARAVAISADGDSIAAAVEDSVYFLVLPRAIPPVVNITNPSHQEKVSGVVAINASITSFDRIAIFIDGNYACGSLPCNWDTSASPEGRHTITVKAADAKGNVGESSIEVIVERKKPAPLPAINESKLEEKISNVTSAINESKQEVLEKAKEIERRYDFSSLSKYLLAGIAIVIAAIILKTRKREKKYRWRR
ncbi:MAG: PQQ-binding-like beta-propeller repeat protein [Methanobacteriota archaeon]